MIVINYNAYNDWLKTATKKVSILEYAMSLNRAGIEVEIATETFGNDPLEGPGEELWTAACLYKMI